MLLVYNNNQFTTVYIVLMLLVGYMLAMLAEHIVNNHSQYEGHQTSSPSDPVCFTRSTEHF